MNQCCPDSNHGISACHALQNHEGTVVARILIRRRVKAGCKYHRMRRQYNPLDMRD